MEKKLKKLLIGNTKLVTHTIYNHIKYHIQLTGQYSTEMDEDIYNFSYHICFSDKAKVYTHTIYKYLNDEILDDLFEFVNDLALLNNKDLSKKVDKIVSGDINTKTLKKQRNSIIKVQKYYSKISKHKKSIDFDLTNILSYFGFFSVLLLLGSYLYNQILSVKFGYQLAIVYNIEDYISSTVENIAVSIASLLFGYLIPTLIMLPIDLNIKYRYSSIKKVKSSNFDNIFFLILAVTFIPILVFANIKLGFQPISIYFVLLVFLPKIIFLYIDGNFYATKKLRSLVLMLMFLFISIIQSATTKIENVLKSVDNENNVIIQHNKEIYNLNKDQIISSSNQFIVIYKEDSVKLLEKSQIDWIEYK